MEKCYNRSVQIQGRQINNDGTPNTCALAGMITGVYGQLNSLADDISAIRAQLDVIQAKATQLDRTVPRR